MSYVICDENVFLKQTQKGFSVVDDLSLATKWSSNVKADNVLKNIAYNKKLSTYNFVIKSVTIENKVVSQIVSPVVLDYSVLDKVREISEFVLQLESRRVYLMQLLREVELNIVDIEHAAEFYELNAAQGYKIYKLLHESRVKRREIKDELEKIRLSLGTSLRSVNLSNLEKSIMGLSNRRYTPRINKELFGV